MVTVKIDNTYACGRESAFTVDVRGPLPGEPVEDWWDEVVMPLTGDGHPCGSRENALYEAVVLTADDPEIRVGDFYSWGG